MPGAIEAAALRERDGKRTVVSHDAKRYRGLLGRALLTAERVPADAEEVAHAGAGALEGLRATLAQEVAPGLSDALDALAEAGGRMAAGVAATGPLADQADGTLARFGEPGELYVRGPGMAMGYYRNEEA